MCLFGRTAQFYLTAARTAGAAAVCKDVITMSCDWFIGLCMSFVIGQSDTLVLLLYTLLNYKQITIRLIDIIIINKSLLILLLTCQIVLAKG